MKKREWVYVHKPADYCIKCDKCGGTNIEWSEFEKMIWCYDCEIDTPGTDGIFDGPIPIGCCELFGISFDRFCLKTNQVLKMKTEGNKLIWEPLETNPGNKPPTNQ